MSNPIKYNTGSETNALKKGNFYIGTRDVPKGPTSQTGFYTGLTPPSGGYTVYVNKASGGPAVYVATNDAELVTLTNTIAKTSYTTKNECLDYYLSQTDKIVMNTTIPNIVTSGLVMALDTAYTPSYPQNGNSLYNLADSTLCVNYDQGNPSWSNNITELTVCFLITKTAINTGYADHPINKWNSGYNVNASLVLYHFGDYLGNGADGYLGFYACGTSVGWGNVGSYGFTRLSVGQTFWVGFQYNSVTGGLPWVNGSSVGGRSGSFGTLGSTSSATGAMSIYIPPPIATAHISHILFYKRELSNAEMIQNYNAVSSRVVI